MSEYTKSGSVPNTFDSISEIITDVANGKMVLMVDDADRENEGDLILAAEYASAEMINFMATHARGLICLPLTEERCDALELKQMVSDNGSGFATAFTVSIEAREGVSTGISAGDRARTILAAVNRKARPRDLVSPGHIFPLRARSGGVLRRAGHTEASVDLARLAGLEPAAVIVEVMSADGTMAKGDELQEFAHRHNIKIGTIADLISYRLETEQTVDLVGQEALETVHGTFQLHTFEDRINDDVHLALTMGNVSPERAFPVNVHVTDPLADLVGAMPPEQSERKWTLWAALQTVAEREEGCVVILAAQDSSKTLLRKAERLSHGKLSRNASDPALFGTGAQILNLLGIKNVCLLGASGQYHPALGGFGISVTQHIEEPAANIKVDPRIVAE